MAVTDLGLSPEEFWSLTWYEWGMYMLRLLKEQKRRIEDQELQMLLARNWMAFYGNSVRDPKYKASPYLPQDFYKLSYDTQLKQEVDPELFARVARRLGGTIKKKNGD